MLKFNKFLQDVEESFILPPPKPPAPRSVHASPPRAPSNKDAPDRGSNAESCFERHPPGN